MGVLYNKLRAQPDDTEIVYLIFNKATRLHKIGFSSNVTKRLRNLSLSAGCEMELRAIYKGTTDLERWLHYKLKNKRKIGEWFDLGENYKVEMNRLVRDYADGERY